jgi:hypothetical protein
MLPRCTAKQLLSAGRKNHTRSDYVFCTKCAMTLITLGRRTQCGHFRSFDTLHQIVDNIRKVRIASAIQPWLKERR